MHKSQEAKERELIEVRRAIVNKEFFLLGHVVDVGHRSSPFVLPTLF